VNTLLSTVDALLTAPEPEQLLPARSQMAFTLMFHIIFVPIGVALPTIMLIANYKGLKRNDAVALTLARRWSHAAGLTFAIGAVSGTVLSFEMGLLWPGLTGKYGDVFGLPFAIEGIAFFLEAILVAIYIYGWRRLPGWAHFWLGLPIPFVALVGAFSIISANAWMNTPAGFTIGPDGTPINVDPIDAIFNKALPYEFIHFILAAYMAAGFTVASIYVVGWLRGRRDRYHRLGILIPLTVAAIVTPLQFAVGDTMARWVANNQPAKFSAMEVVTQSGTDQPEIIFGRYDEATNTVSGGVRIPGLNSVLTGGSRDTYVQGLDAVPLQNRPSNVNIVHWAFDIMVGIGSALILLVAWFAIAYWRHREVPRSKIFLWAAASAGVLTYVAIEAGWIVTEVGRQPWIVYNIERTSDAVTQSGGVWVSFTVVVVLYMVLAIGTVATLRAMSRRWRRQDLADDAVPYGPRPAPAPIPGQTPSTGERFASEPDAGDAGRAET
jgi:cytochrome d ubiquinol oxidase subunit I